MTKRKDRDGTLRGLNKVQAKQVKNRLRLHLSEARKCK